MTVLRRLLLLLVPVAVLVGATTAAAVTSVVPTRIEGRDATLFEGPMRSSGNPVRASSDTQQRVCNGTNNAQHTSPGASATSASVEGLRTVGVDFDAKWFPGFDDYYITRFGPDHEDLGAEEYWGILADDIFTDVGGCQAQVTDGTRVLWAFDAFHQRGFLKLAVAGDTGATPNPFATITAGFPLTVRTLRYYGEKGETQTPFGGAIVAPVTTAANGFQTVQTGAANAVTTAGDGTADIVFATPGWHRIKATGAPGGGPIRSNRIDVCVTDDAHPSCGDAPADTQVREAPPLPPDVVGPGADQDPTATTPTTTTPEPPKEVGAPVVELPRFTSAGRKTGRVGLSWRVLQAGVGVQRWTFASRLAGRKSGAFTTRATGTKGTSALLRLPAGRTWTVRATFEDRLGRTVSDDVGDVLVPIDERAKGVRRSGRWTARADKGAWFGRVLRGRPGATLTVNVAAGKPVVLVRGLKAPVDVQFRVGGKSETYRFKKGVSEFLPRLVLRKAGPLRLRVVRGEVNVDGVGVRP
jgi:hypothetical protein